MDLHAFPPITGLVDLVVAVIGAEFVVLAWRAGWRRDALVTLLFALAPGACLALALWSALAGAGAVWVATWVTASLPFHLADLWRRKL